MGVPLVGCASHRLICSQSLLDNFKDNGPSQGLDDQVEEFKPISEAAVRPRAAIVHNPHFEAGCVKVQRGERQSLHGQRKQHLAICCSGGRRTPLAADHETRDRSSKGQKEAQDFDPNGYLHCGQGTLGLQRQRLQPATLEMILFLRMNDALWDANVVNECC
ncbi:hypothetical protein GQ600_9806 [Phytophthora cactorum]|nr:hypothetical protein GQ600_9806 [Phytophthora cactorum]